MESGIPTRASLGVSHLVSQGETPTCIRRPALHQGGWRSGQLVGPTHVRVRESPQLSILVPTKNERRNIRELVARIEAAVGDLPAEILFIDDSDDGTPEVIEQTGRSSRVDVRLTHREPRRRGDSLAGAVVEGLRAARAPWVCVIDADLQHPPEVIGVMLKRVGEGDVDLVVASRYCANEAVAALGAGRGLLSRSSTTAARVLFPIRLRSVSDPLSGFFLVRREAVDLGRLRPEGFKILLEILISHEQLRCVEVPFRFGVRHFEKSKASLRQGVIYLFQLFRLRLGSRVFNFGRFALSHHGACVSISNNPLLPAVERSGFALVDSSTPRYTGRFTEWSGDENNLRNEVGM